MKNIILALITILIVSSCQQQKIGYVDNGKVINEIQEKKDIEAKYTTKEETLKKKADSITNIYRSEFQALQAKYARASRSKQEQMMQPLNAKAQQFQQEMQAEQQEMQKGFQTEMDSLISKMKTHVENYGKSNGYSYILGTNESISTVMFAKEDTDLTETITKALNDAYTKKAE